MPQPFREGRGPPGEARLGGRSAAIKLAAHFNGFGGKAGLSMPPSRLSAGLDRKPLVASVSVSDPRLPSYDPRVARAFARLVGGWWRGAGAGRAWMLSLTLAALVIGNIGLNVTVNAWNRMFFDALEKRDGGTLVFALLSASPASSP